MPPQCDKALADWKVFEQRAKSVLDAMREMSEQTQRRIEESRRLLDSKTSDSAISDHEDKHKLFKRP